MKKTTTVYKKRRPKILCLGLSYADVEGQLSKLQRDGKDQIFMDCRDGSVDAVIHSVRRNLLTEMDGRDLARCISTEKVCGVDVYTVSQEKGAVYREDRHLDANFNRRDFVRNLRKRFGEDCCFDEIILDYFWIPQGWDASHWTKSFFEKTLVAFATENVLRERTGAIYLPFCLHCFKFIHICFDKLKQYFNVSFIRKKDLKKVSLWKGTQNIDAVAMQHFLGKHLYQEEIYCTFGPKDIAEAMDDPRVSKHELIELARSLEDFHSIRFLRLKLLPGKRPAISKQACGSFIGCIDPFKVKRGFYHMGVDSVTSPRVGTKAVRKSSLSPARSRGEVKAQIQPTRTIKRCLFPAEKSKTPVVVSDSSASSDSTDGKFNRQSYLAHVSESFQTPEKGTPCATPISERSSSSKRVRTSKTESTQMQVSPIDTPSVMINVVTQLPRSPQKSTIYLTSAHRYPTRRRATLIKQAPAFFTPVRVVTPDVTDLDSTRNKRSHNGSAESSRLSPRDLFALKSDIEATEVNNDEIQRHYVDLTFENSQLEEHPQAH